MSTLRSARDLTDLGLPAELAEAAAASLAEAPDADERVVCPQDEAFPLERLEGTLPLPVVLYCRGDTSLLHAGGIAISGSRQAHPAAMDFAHRAALAAARAGINVISGGAKGIDMAALGAAIEAGGTAVLVLPEGIDRAKELELPDSALVVSEFPPDAPWSVRNAMQRNATLAALADTVLVVASGLTGGSWAQGELCLKAGKRLAVPSFGPDIAPGNEKLIEAGAIPIDPADPASVIRETSTEPPARSQLGLFG